MSKIELLAPAKDLFKAKIAIDYGADAVYIGGKEYSLRSRASNFTIEEITNIYQKTWEGCSGADKSQIIAIKISTQKGIGTITIKSIKFYN